MESNKSERLMFYSFVFHFTAVSFHVVIIFVPMALQIFYKNNFIKRRGWDMGQNFLK